MARKKQAAKAYPVRTDFLAAPFTPDTTLTAVDIAEAMAERAQLILDAIDASEPPPPFAIMPLPRCSFERLERAHAFVVRGGVA